MKKKYIALIAVALLLGSCQFGDEIVAYSSGSPVRLISASDSLDTVDAKNETLRELLHASTRSGNLRLVVRTYFYTSGPFSRPYLTVDEQQHGVLHIDAKARIPLVVSKCEFMRQFEVEISHAQLADLKSLQIFNHDTGLKVAQIPLSNPEYMRKLYDVSQEHFAAQDLSGVAGGC